MRKKILNIVGARPNFMKIAPLYRAQLATTKLQPIILHTGQHANEQMSERFFREFNLPTPDIRLTIDATSVPTQLGLMMIELEKAFLKARPDLILVVGDVTSTLAAALTANKLNIPLVHVEAGLRSHDRSMPEEINRILTDQLSDALFVSEQSGLTHLKQEGIAEERTHFVGNVMIDTLVHSLPQIDASPIHKNLSLIENAYIPVTIHRPVNVDTKEALLRTFDILNLIHEHTHLPLILPLHPRTKKSLENHGLTEIFARHPYIQCIEPLGYFDFMRLLQKSRFIATDSGGIQEEAAYLKIPTITLRENTERPATIECGANRLCSTTSTKELIEMIPWALQDDRSHIQSVPLYDGQASQRIVSILEQIVCK